MEPLGKGRLCWKFIKNKVFPHLFSNHTKEKIYLRIHLNHSLLYKDGQANLKLLQAIGTFRWGRWPSWETQGVHGAEKSHWNIPWGDPCCTLSITAHRGSVLHRINLLATHLSNSVSLNNYNLALISISLPPRSRKEKQEKGFIFQFWLVQFTNKQTFSQFVSGVAQDI